ncbi:MAG TPA: sigma-54 dependent transcriptional regulator [Oligoflexia bacterium]|nr:sigma-54 dependent transcriptional regulator [Oligoflexia bacterium]HMR24151.1 sigma-54 dependent transcriptional regulator [Oligoflexia bacterium]
MSLKRKIVVIDDEKSIRDFLEIMLAQEGFDVVTIDPEPNALEKLQTEQFDLLITDLSMPHYTGIDVLNFVQKYHPKKPVIIITAYGSPESAVEAMKIGAFDYVLKPFNVDEMRLKIRNALDQSHLLDEVKQLKNQVEATSFMDESSVGRNEQMQKVFASIKQIAPTHTNVLIFGESGTGKELCARAVHRYSDRADQAFITVNCGAIPENLIESELFGHKKGAFTGADKDKKGLFELANHGTLFLDEVGELPLMTQVKLLRVLQERQIRPIGSENIQDVDVRIVAATNVDLKKAVKEGEFREDLYYRLDVISFELPPLRERKDDIPKLLEHFLKKHCELNNKKEKRFSNAAIQALLDYDYPGNIRELQNIVMRLVAIYQEEEIDFHHLPDIVKKGATSKSRHNPKIVDIPEQGVSLDEIMDGYEKQWLEQALAKTKGVKKHAAKLLNISFRSMRYRLKKHKLDDED